MSQPRTESQQDAAREEVAALQQRRTELGDFVKTSPEYYSRQFENIGSRSGFTWTFNLWAGVELGRCISHS